MKDFWLSCGHHLLDRDEGGGLVVTDDFLKVYFARPELTPPPEACVVERALHAALLEEPRRAVGADEIAAMADADARENWQVVLEFRDHLLKHPTLEAAYLALIRGGVGRTPPLFLNQLVHVILRNVLDECEDPFVLRAGELFYRSQRVTTHEGSLLVADEETIAGNNPAQVSPLVGMLGIEKSAEIDVLNDDNADTYYERSDRYDMALDLTAGRRGHEALGEVIARWIKHLLAVEAGVVPVVELKDARFTWYVGLDAEGTRIGDMLWNGEGLDEATQGRVVALYALRTEGADAPQDKSAPPAYLILGMSAEKMVRMKPQNLLTGLNVKRLETAT
jgi:hypothetical protein